MSHARISSGVGVRPTWYVGDCALSVAPRISTKASSGGRVLLEPADLSDRALDEVRIVHAPIGHDSPHLNRVVRAFDVEVWRQGLVPELRDLRPCWLHRTEFVRAARHDLALLAVPRPRQREPRGRHAMTSR